MSLKLPLISFCIPTYNRAIILEKTLNNLYDQIGSDDNFEIIVVDNCSTDGTENLALNFQKKYQSFNYFRNSENLGFDENINLCLSFAKGIAVKPLNDYALLSQNAIPYLKQIVLDNLSEKPAIFLLNGLQKLNSDVLEIQSLKEFIDVTSFWGCWLSGGLFWKDDLNLFSPIKLRNFIGRDFFHFELYLSIVSNKSDVRIYNRVLFINQQVSNKGGYNFFKVFTTHYLGILKYYLDLGFIDTVTFTEEKRRLFKSHLLPYIIELKVKKRFNFDTKGAWSYIRSSYSICELVKYTLEIFFKFMKKRITRLFLKVDFND